jgi:hypothetical protein
MATTWTLTHLKSQSQRPSPLKTLPVSHSVTPTSIVLCLQVSALLPSPHLPPYLLSNLDPDSEPQAKILNFFLYHLSITSTKQNPNPFSSPAPWYQRLWDKNNSGSAQRRLAHLLKFYSQRDRLASSNV